MRPRMPSPRAAAALLLLAAAMARAEPPTPASPSRGEMLYSLHCIACHSREMHWRDKGVVTDWRRLVAEVDLWQRHGKLGWERADVLDTARYLNTLHYRYAIPENP